MSEKAGSGCPGDEFWGLGRSGWKPPAVSRRKHLPGSDQLKGNSFMFTSWKGQKTNSGNMFPKPTRTPLVFLVILVAGGAALWTACQGFMNRESDRKTNFLIILTDDLGYGDLGCFGNQTIKTPNLDRLASQGMRLTSCYAAAPVCSPSRGGIAYGAHAEPRGGI